MSIPTWACRRHEPPYRDTPNPFTAIVLPHRQATMDLTMAIGVLSFGLHYQREEVQLLLEAKGIPVSTGLVSRQRDEFLVRWKLFTEQQLARLAPGMTGIVLLIDGTQEAGGLVTYRAYDAVTRATLLATTIRSENEPDLRSFLETVKSRFPSPPVIVRDGSQAAKNACDAVFPGVPQQLCHQHFLRDAGNALLGSAYEALRKAVLATEALAKLNALARTIAKTPPPEADRFLLTWVRLLVEYINHPREDAGGQPFRLAYLEVMTRARQALAWVARVLRWTSASNRSVPALLEAHERLISLTENPNVREGVIRVSRLWGWFVAIRDLMRLERIGLSARKDAAPLSPEDRDRVLARLYEIRTEALKLGAPYALLWEGVCKRFEQHQEELWVMVNVPGMVRVTNPLEGAHRKARQGIRRRTGRQDTSADMERVGNLLSLWANVECEWFVKHALQGVDLRAAFLAQDPEVVERELAAVASRAWSGKLPVEDRNRSALLEEFVGCLEQGAASDQLGRWVARVQVQESIDPVTGEV